MNHRSWVSILLCAAAGVLAPSVARASRAYVATSCTVTAACGVPSGISVIDRTTHTVAAYERGRYVDVISTQEQKLVTSLFGLAGPGQIAVSPDSALVYVTGATFHAPMTVIAVPHGGESMMARALCACIAAVGMRGPVWAQESSCGQAGRPVRGRAALACAAKSVSAAGGAPAPRGCRTLEQMYKLKGQERQH
jgi:hypothetical protein